MWGESRNSGSGVAMALFTVSVSAGAALALALENHAPLVVGLLAGLYLLNSRSRGRDLSGQSRRSRRSAFARHEHAI
jgi:hypothetical protein